jgi:hypothetical protein
VQISAAGPLLLKSSSSSSSSGGGGGGGVTDALWRTRVQSKVGCPTNHTMAHPKIHQNGHVTPLTAPGPAAPTVAASHSPPHLHNFCCATQAAPGVALQPAQTLLTGWVWVMEGNK